MIIFDITPVKVLVLAAITIATQSHMCVVFYPSNTGTMSSKPIPVRVFMYMYICMYVLYAYIRTYVCMYACMYVCM